MSVLKKVVRESFTEAAAVKWAEEQGAMHIKLIGAKGWPDQLFLLPGGKKLMCEFKSQKGVMSPMQKHISRLLAERGHAVVIVDNFEDFKRHYALPLP